MILASKIVVFRWLFCYTLTICACDTAKLYTEYFISCPVILFKYIVRHLQSARNIVITLDSVADLNN